MSLDRVLGIVSISDVVKQVSRQILTLAIFAAKRSKTNLSTRNQQTNSIFSTHITCGLNSSSKVSIAFLRYSEFGVQ